VIEIIQPPRERNVITGGYRYNAEVGARLQEAGAGRIVEVAPEDLASHVASLTDREPETVAVIDSLYLLRLPAIPDPLLAHGPTRLLLHFLPSRDPGRDRGQREHYAGLERGWIRGIGDVITTSSRTARQVAEQVSERVTFHVAMPGLDERFRPPPPAIRRPVSGEPLTVLAIGSLVPGKAQLEITDILAGRPEGAPPVRLVLIGDHEAEPGYTAALRRAAAAPSPTFELVLTGCLEPREVAVRLQRAHLYVSASRYESYGMATAEAVATGIPVLSYRTGDVDEWVDDSANGYLVEPGDEAAFRGRLLELLASPEKLGALQSRNGALSFPSWDGTFKSFLAACGHAAAVSRVAAPEPKRVSLGSRCELPTKLGTFDLEAYRLEDEPGEALLLRMGILDGGEPPFVRVHAECLTGEILGSLECDCKPRLHHAMRVIADRGRGAIIYLRPEGRGLGLGKTVRAAAAEAGGPNTVGADAILGIPANRRDFAVAALILKANGVDRIHLHTNDPKKITSLERNGIIIESVLPSVARPDRHDVDHRETRYRCPGRFGLEESLKHARD